MRKLFLIPLLLFLFAVPTAVAATGASPFPIAGEDAENASKLVPPFDVGKIRALHHKLERRAKARARKRARAAAPAPHPTAPQSPAPPHLEAIAACESGGDPGAVSSNGMYRGKYQFSTTTWQAVGGSGDPAAAPEAEQDKRAAMLYAQSGAGQWPICGR